MSVRRPATAAVVLAALLSPTRGRADDTKAFIKETLRQAAVAAEAIDDSKDADKANVWRKAYALGLVASLQARSGDRESALATVRRMDEVLQHWDNGTVYQSTMVRIDLGDFEGALKAAYGMAHPQPQLQMVERIGLAMIKQGRKEQAKKVFLDGLGVAKSGVVPPSDKTTNAQERDRLKKIYVMWMARGLARAGDAAGALEATDLLAPEGDGELPYRLRTDLLLRLADTFNKVGDEAGGLAALAKVVESQRVYETKFPGKGGGGYAVKALAELQAEFGRVDESLATVARVDGEGNRAAVLEEIVSDLVKRDDLEGSLRAAGLNPFPAAKLRALGVVAAALRKRGDRAQSATLRGEAEALVADLKSDRAATLRALASWQLADGERADAVRTAESIEAPVLKVEALREIATADLDAGNKPAAVDVLSRAVEAAGEIEGNTAKVTALTEVAAATFKAGDGRAAGEAMASALKEAATIKKPDKRCEAYQAVMAAQYDAGLRDDARASAGLAGEAALAITSKDLPSHFFPAASFASQVAEAQARKGDEAAARDWAAAVKTPLERSYALMGAALGVGRRLDPKAYELGDDD